MRETLIVSSRGQITLPAGMRKHLGIAPGRGSSRSAMVNSP